jgi:GMP synthase-like glutamine amidotransferase
MNEILVFRHAAGEGPGYFARFLDRHAVPFRLIKVDQNEAIPESIDHVAGLVFMGGPMSVNDDLPWIPRTLDLIRRAIHADVPVLGHCLGGQLMSKALGGQIGANRVREIGWLPVARVDNPVAGDWFNGLQGEFEVFHWHGETFTIPTGATHILKSDACAHQGFAIGKSLALQCHVEMLPKMIHDWSITGREEIKHPCATVQSLDQMTVDMDHRIQRLHKVADIIYTRWLQGIA